MRALPVVDLPQPDSPTRPRVSPRSTSMLTSLTAWTLRPVLPTGNSTCSRSARRRMSPDLRRWSVPLPATSGSLRGAGEARPGCGRALPGSRGSPPGTSTGRRGLGLGASVKGGSLSWHLGWAYLQRGAKLQPLGGLIRSGGRPPMISSLVWLGWSSLGIEFSSDSVYGIFMSEKSTGVGARSTILPAYITAISSVRPATTPRSWVTRIMAMCRSVCWRLSRLRICACTVTSSAVVGSSAKSSLGPQARAMAMVTRWRMPPDSWWGYSLTRWPGSGMPTDASRAMAVSLA